MCFTRKIGGDWLERQTRQKVKKKYNNVDGLRLLGKTDCTIVLNIPPAVVPRTKIVQVKKKIEHEEWALERERNSRFTSWFFLFIDASLNGFGIGRLHRKVSQLDNGPSIVPARRPDGVFSNQVLDSCMGFDDVTKGALTVDGLQYSQNSFSVPQSIQASCLMMRDWVRLIWESDIGASRSRWADDR